MNYIKPNTMQFKNYIILLTLFLCSYTGVQAQHSVAREWNDLLLEAIRDDFARPTVHARNLFHISAAMYDAWAVLDDEAETYLLGKTVDGFDCPLSNFFMPIAIEAAREEAIAYAAYRLIQHRFANSPGSALTNFRANNLMANQGYVTTNTSTDYTNGDAAALGNYIAQCYINYGLQDGSNEQNSYENTVYEPVNDPLVMAFSGNNSLDDPNRWQPLTLDVFIDQSGNEIPFNTPDFLSPEWGQVSPFALSTDDLTTYNRDGFDYWVYHDPGTPPYIDTTAIGGLSEEYKWGFCLVSIWSSHLDPTDGEMIDISPASIGNIPLDDYPDDIAGLRDFYNYLDGGDPSAGHTMNPVTGQPYEPQMVPRGDYGRVLAEFWADGPDSETPPGHWFTILNYVNDHPLFEKRFRGTSDILDDLEWDVKAYFLMGGAMHDAAITAWGIKGYYDYLRPVSAIRSMADRGQSSDPSLMSYHPGGILLEPGYIELVEVMEDPLAGSMGENIGKIKVKAWKGPDYINIPSIDEAGVDWILAEDWWPYQRPSFVTPPFAGYISGHSTFSRAAADLMTMLTGDEFFPGGVGEFIAEQNEFLVFEDGPSMDITLQWATYRDASDQTSLSRIWGGIHPPADDIPGRLIGIEIANDAFAKAEEYFYEDADNDGYYSYEDCDDTNAFVNPTFVETCDGLDNDCNGLIDDGLTINTYFADTDNDGFGNMMAPLETCQSLAPMGYVTNSSDCDDTNAAINPSMSEVCDGTDNNCSGFTDDGLTVNTYFADVDNDGFGDINSTVDTCITFAPMGYVTNSSDCDDTNAAINPSVSEVCDDIDNDCSGVVDDSLPLNTYFMDADNDGFGDLANSIDICESVAPVGYVINALDCDDSNNLVYPSAPELCDDLDNDCNNLIDDDLPLNNYYLDTDNDGFGNLATEISICALIPPAGYVVNSGDCDDADFDFSPNAVELCDDLDNNCDGLIDEGLVLNAYYADTDSDGFGDANSKIEICYSTPPMGYVVDNRDCDDSNASIYPGATEIADNGIDEDCSGVDLFLETKVFPNPFEDIVTIHYNSPTTSAVQLRITASDGRLIHNEMVSFVDNRATINLHDLAAGVYIIWGFEDGKKVSFSQRIVKN